MREMLKIMVWLACTVLVSFTSSSSSSSSSPESFIYVGCTQLKYTPGSPYESSLNSVLASLVNSASMSNFNNLKSDAVYGLFQCRGDLSSSDCHTCVATAVSRIGSYCIGTSGGALQLDGCFVKYDNTSFVGALDKSVVSSKCGAAGAEEGETVSRRDAVLAYLISGGGGQYFRVGGSGKVQGMGQCEQDLSMEQCGDCLSEAIQRLRTECATSPWGDMFLAKCYARYSSSSSSHQPPVTAGDGYGYGYTRPSNSESDDNDETEKTLALIIGLIAGVALLIVFISFLGKSLGSKDDN